MMSHSLCGEAQQAGHKCHAGAVLETGFSRLDHGAAFLETGLLVAGADNAGKSLHTVSVGTSLVIEEELGLGKGAEYPGPRAAATPGLRLPPQQAPDQWILQDVLRD